MSATRSLNMHGRTAWLHLENLRRRGSLITLGLLLASAAILHWRWSAGSLLHPLRPSLFLLTGILVTAVAALIRIGRLFSATDFQTPRRDLAVGILTTISAAGLILRICIPGTPAVCIVLVGLILAAEEIAAWVWHFRCWDASIRVDSSRTQTFHPAENPDRPERVIFEKDEIGEELLDAMPSEEVVQQLTRSRTAVGTEELGGWLRMSFLPGQRSGSIHIAFCPPMRAVPEVFVEQADGPEVRIKTGQLLAYGARLDLKLVAGVKEPASVLLQFVARTVR